MDAAAAIAGAKLFCGDMSGAHILGGEQREKWRTLGSGFDGGATVQSADISEALDDMLFTGGKLNVKLLGGAREMSGG